MTFPYIYKKKKLPNIVTWADGTVDEIKAMLDAHDAGDINIYDFWSVGDERTVSLSAIAANPNGAFITAMDAQNVTMVLMNEGYMSQSGIHYVVGQKDCLNKGGRMNSTDTNAGSWKDCLMRADLSNLYYNALPSDFKSLLKQFDVLTAKTYSGSINETTQDYIALFAEKEVFGTRSYSNATEAAVLLQIKYYETSSNRQKTQDTGPAYWWERSPDINYDTAFCVIRSTGIADEFPSNNKNGISPFCCI